MGMKLMKDFEKGILFTKKLLKQVIESGNHARRTNSINQVFGDRNATKTGVATQNLASLHRHRIQ